MKCNCYRVTAWPSYRVDRENRDGQVYEIHAKNKSHATRLAITAYATQSGLAIARCSASAENAKVVGVPFPSVIVRRTSTFEVSP